MKDYEKIKKRILKDRRTREEYERMKPEFKLAAAVIKKRLQKGWSQSHLAGKVGTKQPVISRIEQGVHNPTLKLLSRLAEALGAKLEMRIR